VLAADGTFLPDERFVTLPAVPGNLLSIPSVPDIA